MATITSEREVWDIPTVLVTDNGNSDIFADGISDFPLPLLLGAPLFKSGGSSPHMNASNNSEENGTLSTVMDDDLVDSMLESCFQSAHESVYGNASTTSDNSREICMATAMQQVAGEANVSELTCETDLSAPLFNHLEPRQGAIGDTLAMLDRPDTRNPHLAGAGVNLSPYIPHMTTETKSSQRRSGPGKIRKTKKSRAPARPWSEQEHQRFKESLELFGRNWERCAAYIGTRRAQLVRSHAQKYLIKLWKLGEPLPKKVAESGNGYTLSGKPLHADSASARSYLTKIPCPNISQE